MFNATMDPNINIADVATCTTCTPTEDFSNYWTATLFFKAANGSYKAVPTFGNELGFTKANGGQTVYYLTNGKVTAFKPGFRMIVGDPARRTSAENAKDPSLTFSCLQNSMTRNSYIRDFPKAFCPGGIMISIRFPTCWDGKNTDSPDHKSQSVLMNLFSSNTPTNTFSSVAYPSGRACPTTHPVSVPQVFYETYWNTKPFQSIWPKDGSQPLVWSFGDKTGKRIDIPPNATYIQLAFVGSLLTCVFKRLRYARRLPLRLEGRCSSARDGCKLQQ